MLLSIDGTIIFVFLSFLIFLFLMNLICYKPIMKVIGEREKFYEKNKRTVLDTENKKNEVIKTIENEISNAKFESSKMLKNALDSNKKEKDEAVLNKKTEISDSINDFENALDDSSTDVKGKLKNEVEDYVKSTVSNVLNIDYNDIQINKDKINEIIK